MLLQEAMGVQPVAATGFTRYTKHDMMLGGHFVPRGSMVSMPFYAVRSTCSVSCALDMDIMVFPVQSRCPALHIP